MLDVNSAIAVEKEIAADTIGTVFAATRNHFLPFVEQCTLELVQLLPHYYEGIRKSATDSLLEIVRTFYELSDHQEWLPGAKVVSDFVIYSRNMPILIGDSFQQVPLNPTVKELVAHCLPPLLELYESEDNK
jgi:hypothetical protein